MFLGGSQFKKANVGVIELLLRADCAIYKHVLNNMHTINKKLGEGTEPENRA